MTYFVMKNRVPCCVINVMLSTTTKLMQQNCSHGNSCVFILYSNKKLLIYHFHQETNSIVHLAEIVLYQTFFTSFTVYVKKAYI